MTYAHIFGREAKLELEITKGNQEPIYEGSIDNLDLNIIIGNNCFDFS